MMITVLWKQEYDIFIKQIISDNEAYTISNEKRGKLWI